MNHAGIRDMLPMVCATLLLVVALAGCSDSSDNSPSEDNGLPSRITLCWKGP